MSLNRCERRIAVEAARQYPPGHGESYFSHTFATLPSSAELILRQQPGAVRFG